MSFKKSQKSEKREKIKETQNLPNSKRIFEIIKKYDYILIFLICILVYNTTSFDGIISSDVVPATFLPFSLIVYHNLNFDYR
jgi:hypothetical protein